MAGMLLQGALEVLLDSDGIKLSGHGEERSIKCFNRHHKSDVPSLRVNVVKGTYHCHGCGIRGNAWSYLKKNGYSDRNIKHILSRLGWTDGTIRHALDQIATWERERQGWAKYIDGDPYPAFGGRNGVPRAKCIAQHEYRRADGHLICVRYRYEKLHKKIPKILTFTPSSRGGWWMDEPDSQSIPPESRHHGKLLLYRLPELMRVIKGNDRSIWIVEGEKCVDAVLALNDVPRGKTPPITCLYGSMYRKPARCDLTPLTGRKVLLIADADTKGRKAMLALARALEKLDCEIRLCLPEGEGGYDITDAGGEGGWKAIVAWINQAGIRRWPMWETDLKDYLAGSPTSEWVIEPDALYVACGFKKRPDRHPFLLIRGTAALAGWEYRRVKREPFRDRMMFVRKGAKPKGLPRGRPFASSPAHESL